MHAGIDNYSYYSYIYNMITVGIKDLKNQLSQYLQYVKEGNKLIVTEHDKIIAEISIPGKREEKVTVIEEKLRKLSEKGIIIMAKRQKSCVAMPKIDKEINWEHIYNETRAERIWPCADHLMQST